MATKNKRVIYTDADCHRLVDTIISYKSIVESKKADATTWKQKSAAWDKITEIYNSSTTEPRTSDQLRCKYDNLKKEVRKYEAQQKRQIYMTDGGSNEVDNDIKTVIKLLYEKIRSIIVLPVEGLEPSQGDSDMVNSVDTMECNTDQNETGQHSCNKIITNLHVNKIMEETANSGIKPQEVEFEDINKDWSDYTPTMLKSKKHPVLKEKKSVEETNCNGENYKLQMFNLKKSLLEKEAAREEEYHQIRMKKEVLQCEKLELEIKLLRKQLES